MNTFLQPILPGEIQFTDAELSFMEESPPGLFPENQDSNFGFIIRKVFSDRIQELIGQQQTIYNERFINTSTEFLDIWESQYGLPMSPSNRSVVQRRQDALSRKIRGAFTRSRRAGAVEKFIIATFGDPIQLTPSGVPLVPEGVPLFTETADVSTLYLIVEDILNFHYQVRILNTIAEDTPGLTRELDRITPAHYSYDIVHVAVL